tara:strand:- start:668 stop:1075 length:408 start_codon:yes stop_codon:yes gene_type:complete
VQVAAVPARIGVQAAIATVVTLTALSQIWAIAPFAAHHRHRRRRHRRHRRRLLVAQNPTILAPQKSTNVVIQATLAVSLVAQALVPQRIMAAPSAMFIRSVHMTRRAQLWPASSAQIGKPTVWLLTVANAGIKND